MKRHKHLCHRVVYRTKYKFADSGGKRVQCRNFRDFMEVLGQSDTYVAFQNTLIKIFGVKNACCLQAVATNRKPVNYKTQW